MSINKRTFGEIPGNPEGECYKNRWEVWNAGLHKYTQAGISGTRKEGADAIVLNGGYEDDHDEGDVVIYTGHGGQDEHKQQIADQSLDDSGNAALVKSQLDELPVRVIRGYGEKSQLAPKKGYRYDGLYRVVRHWFKIRKDGFRVCQFRMAKIGSPFDVPDFALPSEGDLDIGSGQVKVVGPAERRLAIIEKMNRRIEVVRNVKGWHGNCCQVCGESVELPSGPSSQAAHIKGLGSPHHGPDIEENVLCLCPNDHLRFDNGAIYLTDDLKVVDALTGNIGDRIRTSQAHRISIEYVRHHRACWTKNDPQ